MTDRRSYAAAFVLAPVAAGALSFATSWALVHGPGTSTAAAPVTTPAPAAPSAVAASTVQELDRRLTAASRRHEAVRVRLLRTQHRIRATARRLDELGQAASRATASGRSAPSAPPVRRPAPAASLPHAAIPPAPVRPAPPPAVHTTTRAS